MKRRRWRFQNLVLDPPKRVASIISSSRLGTFLCFSQIYSPSLYIFFLRKLLHSPFKSDYFFILLFLIFLTLFKSGGFFDVVALHLLKKKSTRNCLSSVSSGNFSTRPPFAPSVYFLMCLSFFFPF